MGLTLCPYGTGDAFISSLANWDGNGPHKIPTGADILTVVHEAAQKLAVKICGA